MYATAQMLDPQRLFITPQEKHMNKNQIKGTAKEIVGKVQEEAGKLVDSDAQQIKGLEKQISGKAQKSVGDVEEIIKDKVRSI